MTSNNPTGRTRGIWHVRDECGDEITVTANPHNRSVDVETEHDPFSFDLRAAHKLACVLLLACEEVLSGPAEAGEQQ